MIHPTSRLLIAAALLAVASGCASSGPTVRAVTWDVLAAPTNAPPPSIEADQLVLLARPIRTHRVYAPPVAVEFDAALEDGSTNGLLSVCFVPAHAPQERHPSESLSVGFAFRPPQNGRIQVFRTSGGKASTVEGKDFALKPGTPFHVKIEVSTDRMKIEANGESLFPKTASIPAQRFHIQLDNRLPNNRWRIRNFSLD